MIFIKRIVSLVLLLTIILTCLFIFTPTSQCISLSSVYVNNQSWTNDAEAPLKTFYDELYVPVDAFGMFPYMSVVNKTDNGGTFIVKNIVTGEYFSAICRINRVYSSKSNLPLEIKIESVQLNNRNYYYVPLDRMCELMGFSYDSYSFDNGNTYVRIKDDTDLVEFEDYLRIISPESFDDESDTEQLKKIYLMIYDVNEYSSDLCEYIDMLNIDFNYLVSYDDLLHNLDTCLDILSYDCSLGLSFDSTDNLSWLFRTSNTYIDNYLNLNVHYCFSKDNQNYNFSYGTGDYYCLNSKYYYDESVTIDDIFISPFKGNIIIVVKSDEKAQERISKIYNVYANNKYGKFEFAKISYLK